MVFVENKNDNMLILPRSTTLTSSNCKLKIWSEIDNVVFQYIMIDTFNPQKEDLERVKGVNNINEGDVLAFEAASTSKGFNHFAYVNAPLDFNLQIASLDYHNIGLFEVFNVKHFDGYIQCELVNYYSSKEYFVGRDYEFTDTLGFVDIILNSYPKTQWNKEIDFSLPHHSPIRILEKDVQIKWTTYDNQEYFPKGWDENSVVLTAPPYNSDRYWKNDGYDLINQEAPYVNLSWQGHNIQWNVYRLKEKAETMRTFFLDEQNQYCTIYLDLSSLKENHEYRYELQDLDSKDKTIIESGLLMIKGQNDSAKPQNYNIKHEYKQYNG